MTTSAGDRRIELTVQRSDGTLHGHIRDLDGPTREFTGWLSLLSALESLLAEPQTASTEGDT